MWNPDYFKEITHRIGVIKQVENDPRLAECLRVHYKDNPVDFINDWCVTYDPRKKSPEPKLMPFKLFPKQEEFVWFLKDNYEQGESGLIEKARDIGASWVCCGFSVWLWSFHDNSTIGWGSRKEEYVDKKDDPKAIFPKIRQIIEYLPAFLKPEGFNMAVHAPHMRIINPQNGSVIAGEAGDNIGRGGRTGIYFKDESAWYERPELVEAALGDNTDVQIDISSVNGTNNVFYRRRMAGVEWERGKHIPSGKTRVFVFDWRDHPNKTQEWYDKRRAKAEEEGLLHVFKQEVDRDYIGSQDNVVIPYEWINSAVDAHKKLDLNVTGLVSAGQDIADDGGDKNALVIRKGVMCTYAKHWGGEAGEAANIAIPICNQKQVSNMYYDCIGVGSAFKTQINTLKEQPSWNRNMNVHKWNAGDAVKDPFKPSIPNDPDSPKNKDVYFNWKAQAWYNVRARFYKTHLAVTKGQDFPDDELIVLDSTMEGIHQLKLELSQVKQKKSGNGKIVIDKKPDGGSSPNLADAFIMCYNPTNEKSEYQTTKASDYF